MDGWMTDINYEALAKALASAYIGPRDEHVPFEGWWEYDAPKQVWDRVARAVVAALREQGFVVVQRDVPEQAVFWLRLHTPNPEERGITEQWVIDQLAALAAPDDGETS